VEDVGRKGEGFGFALLVLVRLRPREEARALMDVFRLDAVNARI